MQDDLFGEVISNYTAQDAAEDGVLVPVSLKDAVTRTVWEYLAEKAPLTSKPPCNWPVEMMGWFKAGSITQTEALKMIAKHGKEAQEKYERKMRDNKALAMSKGIIGRDARTAKRVFENNEGGGIFKLIVADTVSEILGLVEKELPGATRVLWLMPNELGGVTLMFPEDY